MVVLVLGAVHALSFAPGPLPGWTLPYIQVFSLAALFHRLFRSDTHWQAAGYAFLFGVSNFTLGLYWLFISMHKYGGLTWPLAALGVFILACFLAFYPMLAALLARYAGTGRIDRATLTVPAQLLIMAVWASAWTLLEWLRGTFLTGFPWMGTGYAHVEGVFAAWAPITGVYGLAWMASFSAAAIAMFFRRPDTRNDVRSMAGIAVALTFGLGGILLGYMRWTHPHGEPIVVRLTQGAVPQSEKFDPDLIYQGIRRYMELAATPAKSPEGQPVLIVLPETVVPVFQDLLAAELWDEWRKIAAAQNAEILMGVPVRDNDGTHYTNSAIAFNGSTPLDALTSGQLAQRYDKHHLVPFGEFVPPGFRWFVDAMSIPLGDFDRGVLGQTPFSIQGQRIAPNICYEDVFGEEIVHAVRNSGANDTGATMLINMSNLAWFGNSWALRQHLQISRLRAIETGRPMLRATNTGMTAAIAPSGHVGAVLNPGSAGILDVEVQGTQGLTPYVKWGNMPILAWSLFMLLAGIAYRKRKGLAQKI